MWSVVEFIDGIQLVPSNWINKNTGQCSWPTYANQTKTNRAIKEKEIPGENWPTHQVLRVFYNAETFEVGMKKLKLAEKTSDLETEDDEVAKKKRKEKAKKIVDDSSTSEDEAPSSQKNLTKHVALPNILLPKQLNFSNLQPVQNDINKLPVTSVEESVVLDIENAEYIIVNEDVGLIENEPVKTPTKVLQKCTKKSFSTPRKHQKSSPRKNLIEQDFERRVMKKLNTMIFELRKIDQRLDKVERLLNMTTSKESTTIVDEFFEDDRMFPLKNEAEVENLEKNLNDKNFFLKVVTSLKMLGGMDSHQTVCNIMKTIFTNSVAEKFSFLGAKLKRSFKQLSLYKVVLASARARHPDITEPELGEVISKWLVGAKLRLSREQAKNKKTIKTLPNTMVPMTSMRTIDKVFSIG